MKSFCGIGRFFIHLHEIVKWFLMSKHFFLLAVFALLGLMGFGQPVVITPPSANIEPGGSVTLTASGATYYQWSPATGLSTTEGPVTVASPMVTTTYTCEGYAPGAESVNNGDFEQGNTGFTSAYQYNSNLWSEGTYYIDSDASLHHENFHGYGHGGSGNFMMVNGATNPGTNVWTQQINVQPNKWYAFSTWACTLAGSANQVALLQFSINGNQIGEVFSAPPQTMVWEQFYELWHSGNSTTATITILNQNTGGDGNDFGLDDISFRELVMVGNPTCTVYVNAMTATATADDAELCEGETTTLHALPTGGSGNYSYSWTPANSLNNPNTQHPEAMPPVGTTTYTCHITDNSWGNAQDVSVTVMVHPDEEEHEHQTICPGDSYDFYGTAVSEPGLYEHHELTQFGCDKAIFLDLDHWPTYDETTIRASICPGETYTFYGTTYNETCQQAYTDQTIHGCDSIVRLDLTVWPEHEVTVMDVSVCPEQLPYSFYGEEYYGATDVTVTDTDIHGCDSAVRLVLTVNDYYVPPTEVVYSCYETTPSYTWTPIGDYQFTFTESGFYTDTLPTDNCEGVFTLDLNFMKVPEEVLYEPVVCDSYTWPVNGQTYTTTCDDYYYESMSPYPCQRTYHLHLTVNQQEHLDPVHISDGGCDSVSVNWFGHDTVFYQNTVHQFTGYTEDGCYREQTYYIENMRYTPESDGIRCSDAGAVVWGDTVAVVTNTEFFSFQYDFMVREKHSECVWDTCVWSISKPSWAIESAPVPELVNGKYQSHCRVFVADRDEDYVVLKARVKNECGAEEYAFYLKSSFLEVEERESVSPRFTVVPNPNNGDMELRLEGFSGNTSVKIYDMTGNLVDQFETLQEPEGQTLPYNLQGHASGVYFFVATGKEGTVGRKIVVER